MLAQEGMVAVLSLLFYHTHHSLLLLPSIKGLCKYSEILEFVNTVELINKDTSQ